jgi:hypothetical protein
MSHVEKPATGGREGAGYFYDTFAFEICFYGIYVLLWDLHLWDILIS